MVKIHKKPIMVRPLSVGLYLPSRAMALLFFFVGCLLCTPRHAVAQEIEVSGLIRREGFTCREIALSLTRLLPDYHRNDQSDTLDALLAFWQNNCGGPEPMVRFHIIFQIETNIFTDEWYPDNILHLLADYRALVTGFDDPPYYYDYFAGDYFEVHPGFSEYTTGMAKQLTRFADLRPIELFFLEYYAREFDAAMERLSSGSLGGTRIDSLYHAAPPVNQRVLSGQHDDLPAIDSDVPVSPRNRYIGAYAGVWLPNGNLNILGNHAQIGLFLGSARDRLIRNFYFMIGFINAANQYNVVVNNMLYSTQNYLGIGAGFDLGAEIMRTETASLITSIGIGVEGFEAFSLYDQETFGLSKFIGSFNLNVGMEYRIKVDDRNHVGLLAKYHIVNYKNDGGTDLSGNVATFGVNIGFGY